jgi:hypothetical protein
MAPMGGALQKIIIIVVVVDLSFPILPFNLLAPELGI